ncbi:MAG TPA: hypothetical protein VJO34_14330 [Methylomirabilota bacterium]|nr:hypothetical protein [Methylomirabilota bacterium]
MAEGLELSIVITGQTTALPAIRETETHLDRLTGTTKRGGEAFDLSNRRSAAFAQEGLSQVAQISPRLSGAIGELAGKSKVASGALQALGAAFLGVEAFKLGFQIGETIRDLIEFGETADSIIERLEKTVEAERKFQVVLAERGRLSRDLRRSIIEDESAVTQLRLRNAGQDAAAVEEQFASKMKLIELAKREKDVEIARLGVKGIDVTNLKAEAERKFQAENIRLASETGARIDEINQQNAEKAIKAQSQFLEASNSRRQAELSTQQITLEGEGRLAEASRVSTAQRLQQIQFEFESRHTAIGLEVKDREQAEAMKLQLIQETHAKALAAIQSEGQALRDPEKGLFPRAAEAAGRQGIQGGFFQGLEKIRGIEADTRKMSDAFAEAQQSGVSFRDLEPEIARHSQELANRIGDLKTEFSNAPAVIDLVNNRLRSLELGGFASQVETARQNLAALGPAATGPAGEFRLLGQRLDEMGSAISTADGRLNALNARLLQIIASSNQAARAIANLSNAVRLQAPTVFEEEF